MLEVGHLKRSSSDRWRHVTPLSSRCHISVTVQQCQINAWWLWTTHRKSTHGSRMVT